MTTRIWPRLPLAAALLVGFLWPTLSPACCPAPPSGKPVVNADQTVIIIWDPATKTEHFIRQASFTSEADDFGFLVPTPAQPDLHEAGNEAFPLLRKLTEPEKLKVPRPSEGVGCACGTKATSTFSDVATSVRVLEEKLVAGFNAVVLEASSAGDLVEWLKEHGYAFSPEIEAWAKPYVDAGWKITALKVAKGKQDNTGNRVTASALRMTFKTDRPLFPYREPDPKKSAEALGVRKRLLRIYFIADQRYQGELTKDAAWTGQVAWANKLADDDRKKALELLKLTESAGPAQWWLTEFEDDWPYKVAPADVYFSSDSNQDAIKRPPIVEYVSSPWPKDVTVYALVGVVFLPALLRRMRRAREASA